MTKIRTRVTHLNEVYTSSIEEFTEDELKELQKTLYGAVCGYIDGFFIQMEDREVYFPKSILLDSVITLIYEKE